VPPEEQTYAAAGVSLATADAIVGRLRDAVEATRTPGVTGGFGAFAGLFAIDGERLLAASTDSVGSKLVLGRRAGRLRWCGSDLAAHGINDVLTTGADPLFFLDYVAANAIDPEQVAELVEGAAEVCRAAGCAILGGETAELPGIYREDELDFCGTVVGLVQREQLIDGGRVEPGDVVVGLPSAGIHANGFSLVRRIVGDGSFDPDLLLPPTVCYLDDVRALRVRADVRALAHVTGGGIGGNLARALPDGVGAVIEPGAWERPPVFAWLAGHGVAEDELRRVFNLGIGYCAVIPAGDVGPSDRVIGRVEAGVAGVEWSDE
jgi:phosphoribosylformylglycinamidine cyclo-ligase